MISRFIASSSKSKLWMKSLICVVMLLSPFGSGHVNCMMPRSQILAMVHCWLCWKVLVVNKCQELHNDLLWHSNTWRWDPNFFSYILLRLFLKRTRATIKCLEVHLVFGLLAGNSPASTNTPTMLTNLVAPWWHSRSSYTQLKCLKSQPSKSGLKFGEATN